MAALPKRILAIDVGERRVGLAMADLASRLASPFKTLLNSEAIYSDINDIIGNEDLNLIVIGLPRNLNGDDTAQTKYARNFAENLKNVVGDVEIFFEDEALSSVRAKEVLEQRKKSYRKEEVDALAASYILDDFLSNHTELVNG